LYYFDQEKELDLYIERAGQYDERCDQSSVIGKGTYGVCFNVGGDAVKITCDLSEVCASIGMTKVNCDSYPKIKEIVKIDNTELWVIRQELCEPLSPKDYRALSKITSELEYCGIGEIASTTHEGLSILFGDGDLDHFEEDKLIEELIDATRDVSKVPLLKELDLHVDNIMRINGRMVLIDQKDVYLDLDRIKLQDKILSRFLSEQPSLERVESELSFE